MHKIITALLIMIISLPSFAARTVIQQNPYYVHSPYYNDYYAREGKFRHPYYSNEYYYQKKTPFKAIKDYFSGQLTGFTPQLENDYINTSPNIYPYPYQPYGKREYSNYSSPWGNGQRYEDYSSGASTGVRILD